ncbi:MAG: NAD-dependent epimerase/dehydratase family protein [bacterium]
MEPSPRTALITGANGFVGSHLTALLVRRGYRVKAMVRASSDLGALEGIGAEKVVGDITRPETLPPLLEEVDLLFHAAGVTKSRDPSRYFRVNEEGTADLVAMCREHARLERLVYISSQAAAGPSRRGRPRTEEDPPEPIGPYGASKLEGEEACRAGAGSIPLTIVRPAVVYGPWERDMLSLFRGAKWRICPRVRGDSLVSLIHAADLADLLERAGRFPGAAGRTYHAADPEPYWMSRLIRTMGEVLGHGVLQVPLPPALLYPAAVLNEMLMRVGGGVEALTRSRIREFRERYWVMDTGRAGEELEWKPGRSLEEGLQETAQWYTSHGWL